jgi:hypothetical protein
MGATPGAVHGFEFNGGGYGAGGLHGGAAMMASASLARILTLAMLTGWWPRGRAGEDLREGSGG